MGYGGGEWFVLGGLLHVSGSSSPASTPSLQGFHSLVEQCQSPAKTPQRSLDKAWTKPGQSLCSAKSSAWSVTD
jgi:hypothetical protein